MTYEAAAVDSTTVHVTREISSLACGRHCERTDACSGFSYNRNNNTCKISSLNMTSLVVASEEDSDVFTCIGIDVAPDDVTQANATGICQDPGFISPALTWNLCTEINRLKV